MGIEEEKKKERKGYIPAFVHTVYNYTKKKKDIGHQKRATGSLRLYHILRLFLKNNNNNNI